MVTLNVKVLLVEDSPSDADLIMEGLEDAGIGHFDITHVDNLADAQKKLESDDAVDSVLLDLGLPDSQGLDTLRKVLKYSRDIPVIVLTGLNDDEIGREAMQIGADDYLVKGSGENSRSNIITRSICFAIERHKLSIEALAAKAKDHHDKQVKKLSGIGKDPVKEPLALSERAPEDFQAYVSRYSNILNHMINGHAEPTGFNMRVELEDMAKDLGAHKAGPHDVVEVHSTTLKAMVKDCSSRDVSSLIAEGHVTSLGLMGMLVSYYRGAT